MKNHQKKSIFHSFSLCLAAVVLIAQFVFIPSTAQAAQILTRSLELQAGTIDGGSKPGGVTNHKFTFTLPSGGTLGSIKFEYCTTAADVGASTCVAPEGMSATGATLGSEVGSGITGMTMNPINANSYYLSRASGFTLSSNTTVTYTINGITNPTFISDPTTPIINHSFFVRISAYTSTDITGIPIHRGTVTASVNEQIIIDGTMPESLIFCTGGTVGVTASLPDCSTATSGRISFNQLFSPTATATTTSQMAASTNAGQGYSITVNGPTLTSGSNTIAGISSPLYFDPATFPNGDTSKHGVAQFGLNLRTNTVDTVAIGADVAPSPNATNFRGQALSGYDTSDTFKFVSGNAVANSGNTVLGATDAQIYTVTYIANVPGSQPAGTYTTTLTYICTPTF